VFILIGAEPHTSWLAGAVERDPHGFVVTGRDLLRGRQPPPSWPLDRPPLLLETSLPGVFAAGDVRYGSTKRVAAGRRRRSHRHPARRGNTSAKRQRSAPDISP
jgi:thioredoxin reductase (NADPH)